ncbi:MAG TPA: DUF4876 domain-containing protein [Bacteroidales bacterium]|jgi:hypothetical protein|nr:DUF4876 domain-containing protein [Bacteroidales bacterium]
MITRTKGHLLYLGLIAIMLTALSCERTTDEYKTYPLNVELVYPDGYNAKKDITVTLTSTADSKTMEAQTDENGMAKFTVTAGVYDASATDNRTGDGVAYVLNGAERGIIVNEQWTGTENVKVRLSESKLSQVIIKEVYYGGTPTDDGSRPFAHDRHVILYNNSALPASLDNVCLAITLPYNPHATNSDYVDGKLFYENEGWCPAGQAFWYFQNPVTLEPYSQLVIALFNAVDNTQTYSKSVNFANPEYYCTYDIEKFDHEASYPSPSEVIPTSHYLKSHVYGTGKAWVFSQLGPAFFIFAPEGQSIEQFGTDANNLDMYGGRATQVRKKVPVKWVLDGVEIFMQGSDSNRKRLNTEIDAGYIHGIKDMGYSIYRNVDKSATEAIKENEGKLVYNYAMGTQDIEGGTTDPSGIDAEASIKNGAKIVFMDTNNSSKDFHQRKEASLRHK